MFKLIVYILVISVVGYSLLSSADGLIKARKENLMDYEKVIDKANQ